MRFSVLVLLLFFSLGKEFCLAQSSSLILRFQNSQILDSLSSWRSPENERFEDMTTLRMRLKTFVSHLHGEGYLQAGVDSMNNCQDTVLVLLHLGKRYRWGDIQFLGWDSLSKKGELPTWELTKRERHPFFKYGDLVKEQEKMLSYWENRGYPFARITARNISIEGDVVDGFWHGERNGFIVWDSIRIKGPLSVNSSFLHRYLGIMPNNPYSEKQFAQLGIRINRLGFGKAIKASEVEFGKGSATAFVYLDKEKANQFEGIVGLMSNAKRGGKLDLSGNLKLLLVNSFHRGETFSFNWQKMEGQTTQLFSRIEFPYLFNTNLGIDAGVRILKQDTSFVNVETDVGVQFLTYGGNYIKAFVKANSSSVLNTPLLSSPELIPDFVDTRSVLYGVGVRFQNMDYPFNPHKGLDLKAEVSAGTRRVKGNSKLPTHLYEGEKLSSLLVDGLWRVNYYLPLASCWTMKIGNQGGVMHNENLYSNELYRLGGLKTLRGFDEESVHASAYGILTGEIRFLPERNSAFFAFWDGGVFKKSVAENNSTTTLWGVGAGMNFKTSAGIFSLSYALGKSADEPLKMRSAKIHFGIVSRF